MEINGNTLRAQFSGNDLFTIQDSEAEINERMRLIEEEEYRNLELKELWIVNPYQDLFEVEIGQNSSNGPIDGIIKFRLCDIVFNQNYTHYRLEIIDIKEIGQGKKRGSENNYSFPKMGRK